VFMVKPCYVSKKKPYLHKVLLNKGKDGISMVITHEQWVLTSFLRLDNLELILVQISRILELWIIIYELEINYPRLIINLELIIKQKIFYKFISEVKFEFQL
jgi:hypothetical protein